MEPRQIYGWLRICSMFSIVNKVYYGHEWIKVDSMVIGFSAKILAINPTKDFEDQKKVDKQLILARIKEWCFDKKLPVEIEDQPTSLIMFKIKIIK